MGDLLMKFSVDLHIHSCLSPCADNDMTPNNIVNMAVLKGLDIIAVTDHNSGENQGAILECAQRKGLLAVPGMELKTLEEVHIICLFQDLDSLMIFQDYIYKNLPPIDNRPEIFGRQLIMDSNDRETGECSKMLITACNISVDEAFAAVSGLGGAAYPAHIDREAYSVLVNLGDIPDSYKGSYLELSWNWHRNKDKRLHGKSLEAFLESLAGKGYNFIKSSDAHQLGDILEAGNYLELEEKSIECLLEKLRG